MILMVSAQQLIARGTCPRDVENFRRLFGDGPIEVSEELVVRYAKEFNWDAAAKKFLPHKSFLGPYREARLQSEAEYNRKERLAREEFDRAKASAFFLAGPVFLQAAP